MAKSYAYLPLNSAWTSHATEQPYGDFAVDPDRSDEAGRLQPALQFDGKRQNGAGQALPLDVGLVSRNQVDDTGTMVEFVGEGQQRSTHAGLLNVDAR